MTPEEFYGGAIDRSFGSNVTLSWARTQKMVTLTMTAGGLTVTAPDPSTIDMPYGRVVQVIANVGTNSFTLNGTLSSPITVAQDQAVFLAKVDDNGTPALQATKWAVIAS